MDQEIAKKATRPVMVSEGSLINLGSDDELPMTSMKSLGRGNEGRVEKVEITATFANKTWEESSEVAMKRRLEEIALIKRLESRPHIIHIFATFRKGMALSVLMSPAADDDLRNILTRTKDKRLEVISDQQMTRALGCLSAALAFIHETDILHGDIKPSNILVHQGKFIITDFGCAKDLSGCGDTNITGTIQGTPMYYAPEMCTFNHLGRPIDVFAMGCVLMEIWNVLKGVEYSRDDADSFLSLAPYHRRLSGPGCVQEWIETWQEKSKEGTDYVWLEACSRMLQENPKCRPSMSKLVYDLLSSDYDENIGHTIFCEDCVQNIVKGDHKCGVSLKLDITGSLESHKKMYTDENRSSCLRETDVRISPQENLNNIPATDSEKKVWAFLFDFLSLICEDAMKIDGSHRNLRITAHQAHLFCHFGCYLLPVKSQHSGLLGCHWFRLFQGQSFGYLIGLIKDSKRAHHIQCDRCPKPNQKQLINQLGPGRTTAIPSLAIIQHP